MLGNLEQFTDIGRFDRVALSAKPERLQQVKALVSQFLSIRRILKGEAASLRGKLLERWWQGPCEEG